ncbi:hypothetical protein SAMN05216326_12527 [Nitrosomonas marina]|uniref:Uncharacterized protein n=1 Tax=Nitrosomonas marina TaxID=917 RepID=A0A1I0E6L7_9PROT|nr:hypothetical protein SAMN05216326_12527 [Nitrosomonas marina]
MNNLFAGMMPFIPTFNPRVESRYSARFPHPTKKGPGRGSKRMRRESYPAGEKFKKAFAAGVATHRGKFRHMPK